MKAYRDLYGNNLAKKDVDVAVRLIIQTKKPTTLLLNRYLHMGIGKANKILELLGDAGVITENSNGECVLVLRREGEAVNAALRQLNKGKK